ncbi:MAG: nucleotidyl transferase AbiEii/AbiGii toxin family protein [Candidatus Absconditabacterales bacterium]
MKLHRDTVLDSKRKFLLDKLVRTKRYGFYLAGGTALALQYGHRISEDFDFFKEGDLDVNQIKDILHREGISYRISYEVPNTLYIDVNGVKVSFMAVKKLTLIDNLISTEYFNIATVKEIGIMKLITIPARRETKDYVDLYYITQTYDLNKLISYIPKKYGAEQNIFVLKKSLLYIDDLVDNVTFIGKKIMIKDIQKYFKKIIKDL